MSYALSFMAITATITHAIIYFWNPIKIHFKRSLQEQPDIHARLMANYRQGKRIDLQRWLQVIHHNIFTVPEWWYACIFGMIVAYITSCTFFSTALCPVVTFAFACVCVSIWPTDMTIWALVVALAIGRPLVSSSHLVLITIFSLGLHDTNWHDPGDHQSASRFKVGSLLSLCTTSLIWFST